MRHYWHATWFRRTSLPTAREQCTHDTISQSWIACIRRLYPSCVSVFTPEELESITMDQPNTQVTTQQPGANVGNGQQLNRVEPEGQVDFGKSPVQMVCPQCKEEVTSEVNFREGCCMYLAYCICLPIWREQFLCFNIVDGRCADVEHKCPSCGTKLGLWKRLC